MLQAANHCPSSGLFYSRRHKNPDRYADALTLPLVLHCRRRLVIVCVGQFVAVGRSVGRSFSPSVRRNGWLVACLIVPFEPVIPSYVPFGRSVYRSVGRSVGRSIGHFVCRPAGRPVWRDTASIVDRSTKRFRSARIVGIGPRLAFDGRRLNYDRRRGLGE